MFSAGRYRGYPYTLYGHFLFILPPIPGYFNSVEKSNAGIRPLCPILRIQGGRAFGP